MKLFGEGIEQMNKHVAGARTLAQVMASLTPAERKTVKRRVRELELEELSLGELRKAQKITQVDIAKTMGVKQGYVSQIESASDLYLSTLEKHVVAMGGKLTLTATFPNRPPVSIIGLAEKKRA